MKKIKRWLVAFGIVGVIMALIFSCDTGGGLEEPTNEDLAKFGAAIGPVFAGIEDLCSLPAGISVDPDLCVTPETPPTKITITFTNYTDAVSGITANGFFAISDFEMDQNTGAISLTLSGNLSFTGTDVSTISFNITIVIGDDISLDGRIEIDGTAFDASEFAIDPNDLPI
jgi:hypothetical protein